MRRACLPGNCALLWVVLSLAFLRVSPSWAATQSQVSFFTPPAYSGSGSLFVADFNGDGKPDLLSSDGTLELGNGDGTFTLGTPVTGTPVGVADFNGDGKPDVLEQGTDTLLVLLGNGDGTFQAPVSTNSGASLLPIAAADLNGDGHADVVGVFGSNLLVYLGKGDGTFAAAVSYSLGATTLNLPATITLGDFNGDGKTDVVVSLSGSSGPGQEIVFLGNGDGTFQPAVTSTGAYLPESAVAGDFNGDGKLDLVIAANDALPPSVYLLLGNGNGTFQAPTRAFYGAGDSSVGLAVADVNGDGNLDLIFANMPLLEVYEGNGKGAFSLASSYFTLTSSGSISNSLPPLVADFNLDGKLDIAVGNRVLLGNGNGTFQGWPIAPLEVAPLQVTVGDFNKNRTQDVAAIAGNDSVYILKNDGTGALTLTNTYTLQEPAQGIATADLRGNGNLDLVTAGTDQNTQDWSYSVLLGNGDGTFQPAVLYSQSVTTGTSQYSMVAADFNNDGKPDFAITMGKSAGTVAILLGNGDGTFGAPAYVFDGGGVSLVSADFNGDGIPDLAAIGSSGIAVLLANGNGTFQPATFPSTTGGLTLFTADLNGDGKADLVTGSGLVFLGNGDGTFTALTQTGLVAPEVFAVADINGDGVPDVIGSQASAPASCCVVYLGNGDGTFGPGIVVFSFFPGDLLLSQSFALTTDMNGDGKPDILLGEFSNGETTGAGGTISTSGIFTLINTSVPSTVALTPPSLSFGMQPVGVSAQPQVVTLTNTGTTALTISALSVTGAESGDFSQTSTCGSSVAVSGSCTITVTFTPTTTGARSATVTITDSSPNSPQSVPLSGTGSNPSPTVGLSPTSLSFGVQAVGVSSSPLIATLANTGNLPLAISALGVTGAESGDFSQMSTCGSSLAAGANCTITVTFTPTTTGARGAAVTITDNAPNSPQSIPLSGTGSLAPIVSITPTSVTFSSQYVGTSGAPQSVMLTNTGAGTLNFTGVTASPSDFNLSNACGSSLAVGASCSIGISFDPTAAGTRTGTLTIADNAAGSPQTVTLTGTGQDFSMAASSSSTATVTPGQTATYMISVAPGGGFNQTVALSCSGAPALSACLVSPNSITLGSSASTATVTVTTTGASAGVTQPISGPPADRFVGFWLAFGGALGLAILASLAGYRRQRRPRLLFGLALMSLLFLGVTISACGGGSSGNNGGTGTSPGTYTLTVTGKFTSGSTVLTHTTNLTLVVQ